jgi:hypothetical protein
LREKENRVLGLRGGSTSVSDKTIVTEKLNDKTTTKPVSVEMPDLIDTSEMDLLGDGGVSKEKYIDTTTTSANVDNNLEEVHVGVLKVAEYPCFQAFLNTTGTQNTRSTITNEADPGFELLEILLRPVKGMLFLHMSMGCLPFEWKRTLLKQPSRNQEKFCMCHFCYN